MFRFNSKLFSLYFVCHYVNSQSVCFFVSVSLSVCLTQHPVFSSRWCVKLSLRYHHVSSLIFLPLSPHHSIGLINTFSNYPTPKFIANCSKPYLFFHFSTFSLSSCSFSLPNTTFLHYARVQLETTLLTSV